MVLKSALEIKTSYTKSCSWKFVGSRTGAKQAVNQEGEAQRGERSLNTFSGRKEPADQEAAMHEAGSKNLAGLPGSRQMCVQSQVEGPPSPNSPSSKLSHLLLLLNLQAP